MVLVIDVAGKLRGLYQEELDLAAVGAFTIRRASHVEPDEAGRWWADLGPCLGPRLGPFATRSVALLAEEHWLTAHVLMTDGHAAT